MISVQVAVASLVLAVCVNFVLAASLEETAQAKTKRTLRHQCSPHFHCPPGTGLLLPCDPKDETPCRPCPPGFYADKKHTGACTPCSQCSGLKAQSCTSTTDAKCIGSLQVAARGGSPAAPYEVLPTKPSTRKTPIAHTEDTISVDHTAGASSWETPVIIIVVVIGVLVIVFFIACCVYRRFKNRTRQQHVEIAVRYQDVLERDPTHRDIAQTWPMLHTVDTQTTPQRGKSPAKKKQKSPGLISRSTADLLAHLSGEKPKLKKLSHSMSSLSFFPPHIEVTVKQVHDDTHFDFSRRTASLYHHTSIPAGLKRECKSTSSLPVFLDDAMSELKGFDKKEALKSLTKGFIKKATLVKVRPKVFEGSNWLQEQGIRKELNEMSSLTTQIQLKQFTRLDEDGNRMSPDQPSTSRVFDHPPAAAEELEDEVFHVPSNLQKHVKTNNANLAQPLLQADSESNSSSQQKLNDNQNMSFFTSSGGQLVREGSAVELHIPRGAVPKGQTFAVQDGVILDQRPFVSAVSPDERIISPIVEYKLCGDKSFKKHVLVKIPHCIADRDLWEDIRVLCSESTTAPYIFKEVPYQSKENNVHQDMYFTLRDGYIYLQTTHFTLFLCTCRKRSDKDMVIDAVVFGSFSEKTVKNKPNREVRLRLYLCDTLYAIKDYLEHLKARENRVLLDQKRIELTPKASGQTSEFEMELDDRNLPEGWRPHIFSLRQCKKVEELVCCHNGDFPPLAAEYVLQNTQFMLKDTSFSTVIEITHRSPVLASKIKFPPFSKSSSGVQYGETAFATTTIYINEELQRMGKMNASSFNKLLVHPASPEEWSEVFDVIAGELGQRATWPLARALGLTNVEIENVQHRHPDDLMEQKIQLLRNWRQKQGPEKATMFALKCALNKVEQKDLAQKLPS
ncbi:uncharacterized protein LOC106172725 [Lingula anatina]|uniref:Uncharacterized protein LOC106172725 n=1 Tax=Lingula anatina TaxID=7574 RepID=A0A1S3JF97_LINAN|nr:uncharacterized protein LOC106172725 [Lingula anatina]XP_013409011.1 uncharacterized protein LOC106172725 [Lingula anatina]XP_013409012.1 uncharacterized protein LOC106172725 [Lingula anatina]XP_013409013.1 uncharacterized protein LOC106172725 [Lingula anatina]XP_013409014.1 uncharacterized protein LOC106172725 [Lingula anatina]XP_013409015.1 uncharacterized protein LOC106172725 [Lingula anatina]|eukprot:XP_013409010.1 uncharacterized protein LOC106172725 [Lingula anatina]